VRVKCQVPEELEFKTNVLLSEMIQKVAASEGFQGNYVGVDTAFGRDHIFLDSLPRGHVYFADVPCDTQVFEGGPEIFERKKSGKLRNPILPVPSFKARSVADSMAVIESIKSESADHGAI
jgi:hypothetical protein